jgi:hypothetical protein
MEIVPYSTEHREAIARMNAKLAAAGSEWQFPAKEPPSEAHGLPIWNDSFIAFEADEAYGGYILKHQQFFAAGRPLEVGNLQLPVSLGQVDGAFARVSAALLIDVLRRSPLCYSIGLGSEETQFAKLLSAAGWGHTAVPFYFSVKSANRFARNIRLGPDRRRMQTVLRTLGRIRLAAVALRLRGSVRSRGVSRGPRRSPANVQELPRFDGSVDEPFEAHAASYSLVGDRRAAALNAFYPEDDRRYIRLVVSTEGRTLGWVLALNTRMHGDKYFGDMQVGSLVDCFSAVTDAPEVVAAADAALTRRGVDVVVSNQLHPAWCAALEQAGYERGPSNFFFYYSEALAEALSEIPGWLEGTHMNRGDGEGPTHL